MAQIQIRDVDGRGLGRINVRIAEGDKSSDEAIFDYETDGSGNKGWPIPYWPASRYTLHVNQATASGMPITEYNPVYESASIAVEPLADGSFDDVVVVLPLRSIQPSPVRAGVIRSESRAVRDDDGFAHFLGATLFWAPYGFRHEPDRIRQNVDYLQQKRAQYARVLGEVDWLDRPILPVDRRLPDGSVLRAWPDYEQVLGTAVDEMYARGIRTQLTIFGGRAEGIDVDAAVERVIAVVKPRQEAFAYIETWNEYTRLGKATLPLMQKVARRLRQELPHLIALSQPREMTKAEKEQELGGVTFKEMRDAMKACGANCFPDHTDRGSGDFGWRMTRQAYDFSNTGDYTGSDQEGPGMDSSVNVLEVPMQQSLKRFLAHMAGAGFYTFHVGAGVSGVPVPAHGRPANLWETVGIDGVWDALHVAGSLLPERVQQWRLVNNGRDDLHPLQLPDAVGDGFWEGSRSGSVNKNYAALHPNGHDFVEVLLGVRGSASGPDDRIVRVGQALRPMHVRAHDPVTGFVVDERDLAAGEWWELPGRRDTMAGYIVIGRMS